MLFRRSQSSVVSPAQSEPVADAKRESIRNQKNESDHNLISESDAQHENEPDSGFDFEPDDDFKCDPVSIRKPSQRDIVAAKRERRFLRQLKKETGKDYIVWIALLQAQEITDRDAIIGWFQKQGFPFAKASWMERIYDNGGKPIYAPKPKPKEARPNAEQHAKWLYETLVEIYNAKPRLLREDFRKRQVEDAYATWCKENGEKPYKWNTLAKHLNKLTTKKYVDDVDTRGRAIKVRVYPVISERKVRRKLNYEMTAAA